jgi:cytochrome c oxidase subunit 4
MAEEHEAHPVNYTLIFFALCGFTAFSVLADVFGKHQIGKTVLAAIVLSLATFKATCVIMYFMHMKFEGAWKYVLLGPTIVLALAIPFTLAPDISFHYYHVEVPQNDGIPPAKRKSSHVEHVAPGLPSMEENPGTGHSAPAADHPH